jgi:hypothetical protein
MRRKKGGNFSKHPHYALLIKCGVKTKIHSSDVEMDTYIAYVKNNKNQMQK